MAIALANQQGGLVMVYDENGKFLFSRSGELHGFTGASVTVKQGSMLFVYDESGNFKFSRSI